MLYDGKIWVATDSSHKPVFLLPQMANRHGLIAGATGTGKTVTLKVIAEGFSDMGVPVFLGDIKGDLSGMVTPGTVSEKIGKRLMETGVSAFRTETYPTVFWDVYGEQGAGYRQRDGAAAPVPDAESERNSVRRAEYPVPGGVRRGPSPVYGEGR